MIDELRRDIRALGARIDPDVSAGSAALYRPLHASPDRGAPASNDFERDLRYGAHERHRLDVLRAGPSRGLAPVLLFVHGGGFVRGDKTGPGLFYYDNVAQWGASHGLMSVTMTYRLAPESPWPAGAEDVASAVRWLRLHARDHGGDPDRIFLMGHSAGASHCAAYVAHPAFHDAAGPGLAGCILVSGLYDLVVGPGNPAYFGDDPSLLSERSSKEGLVASGLPLMVCCAEWDPPSFTRQMLLLLQAFADRGLSLPRFVQAAGHNHYTIVHQLNTAEQPLGAELLDFMAGTRPSQWLGANKTASL